MALRASILTPTPVPGCALCLPPVAGSLRIVLLDDLPAPPQSPVQLIVIEWTQEPDGLPAARTSRKGRCAQKTPCPITCHRVSLALPRPSEADEQTTNPSALQDEGF
uniref:Uncharacterized protein n=1 Tax=Pseudomonas syringae TaxID=317 RepID=I3W2F8_PSESX|nr:hypothetical protein [Pseudomonas syringae]